MLLREIRSVRLNNEREAGDKEVAKIGTEEGDYMRENVREYMRVCNDSVITV